MQLSMWHQQLALSHLVIMCFERFTVGDTDSKLFTECVLAVIAAAQLGWAEWYGILWQAFRYECVLGVMLYIIFDMSYILYIGGTNRGYMHSAALAAVACMPT
jgi:hypothetical protein